MKEHKDTEFFEQAAAEIGSGKPKRGIFAKAYSEALGDDKRTRALYIQYRAEELKAEIARNKEVEEEAAATKKANLEKPVSDSVPVQITERPVGQAIPRSGIASHRNMLLRLIEFLRRHLKTVIRACLALLVLLVVADALPFIVDKHHAHTNPEHIPGFWAVYGFVACVLIVIASKAFGHAGIMTREDYYDE